MVGNFLFASNGWGSGGKGGGRWRGNNTHDGGTGGSGGSGWNFPWSHHNAPREKLDKGERRSEKKKMGKLVQKSTAKALAELKLDIATPNKKRRKKKKDSDDSDSSEDDSSDSDADTEPTSVTSSLLGLLKGSSKEKEEKKQRKQLKTNNSLMQQTELPMATLKALAISLGYNKSAVAGNMTVDTACSALGSSITTARLRAALQARSLQNTGNTDKKLHRLFEYELKNL